MNTSAVTTGYVGRSVPRVNDPRLLRGQGQFVDDRQLPGMLHATILRSPAAHGRLVAMDFAPALEEPGVVAAFGPDEVESATRALPCVWIAPGQRLTEIPVVSREIRYVGSPLGVVLGESRAHAEDGADVTDLRIDQSPAVVDPEEALGDEAPLLYPEWGSNVCAEFDLGDAPAELEAVFQAAPTVIERRFRINRVAGNPLETRGIIADWNPGTETLTVWMSTQVPHHARDHIAHALRLRADQVHVIGEDVGGGFGSKEHVYPDEVIICLAAMRLERPVKWIEDRAEHLVASYHARDAVHHARLALDGDGKFLALQSVVVGNLGGHPSNVGTGPFRISGSMLPGPYRLERAGATIRAVVTNTTPTGAYRGFGMQEAAWVRERLVDEAARELGTDPVQLRLRNVISPEDLPYTTRTMQNYDSGSYGESLLRVEEMARARRQELAVPGERRGIGYATHVEFTGLGPSKVQKIVGFHLGGFEPAVVRMDPDATVTVSAGVMGMGQGIETGLAQLAADHVGVPIERVNVRLGDTGVSPYSAAGSIASRSMTVGGGAVISASQKLRKKVMRIAAHQLEVDVQDLEFKDGVLSVRGSPDVKRELGQIAHDAWLAWDMPDGEAPGLEERLAYDPEDISYSYATHAAEVGVDIETGQVKIYNYWVCHDSGVLVNPMICDGQIVGGIAQGIGIALHEEVVHEADGQPLTTTYLDYVLPLNADVPDVQIDHLCTPSPFVPGGMKGLGEGGTIASPVALGNAVAAAIPEIATNVVETPMSPRKLWTLMHEAGLHHEADLGSSPRAL